MPESGLFSIVLAGGSGTRMGTAGRHKVCFEIAGRPAIGRALDIYSACGIGPHIVVVGALAEQVMHTISQSGHEAIYAFQAEQRGTGHAAKQGARILQQMGYTGSVLVVAGDVIIQPVALRKLLTVFAQSDCDLALMVGPREHAPTAGRVVTDEAGHPLTIVETRDISRRRALAQVREMAQARPEAADLRQEVLQVLQRFIPDAGKAKLAFGAFWDRLHQPAPLDAPAILRWIPPAETAFHLADAAGRPLTLAVDTVDQMPWINLSVYLCKAPALYYALERLTDENAQREEYLTDIVPILSQARAQGEGAFRLQIVAVDDHQHVMSFNTLPELQAIEAYYRRLEQAGSE